MKFGIRIPSLKKKFAARTSLKRVVSHSMGFKAPKGMGIFTSPKRAIYNKVYNKTSMSLDKLGGSSSKKPASKSSTKQKSSTQQEYEGKTSMSLFWKIIIFVLVVIVLPPVAIGYVLYKLYKQYGGTLVSGDKQKDQS